VRPADRQVHLRILETTDLHVHVLPYDYYADRASDSVGLARTATLIAEMRAEAANVLLFDNGDFLQGNPLGDYMADARAPADAPHPVMAAMNALAYDAGTLGNHEFNYGLEFLTRTLAQAAHPVVSANARTGPGRTLVPPWTILDRTVTDAAGRPQPIRIGVVGFLPPQTALWDRDVLAGQLETPDILDTAAAVLPGLRAAGADIVVALCHSGIGPADPCPGMENAATALAAVPGIDVVLAGHTHDLFPAASASAIPGVDAAAGTLCGKPAVMAGCFGSHLGVIDLLLEPAAPQGWRIAAAQSRTVPILDRAAGGSAAPRVASAPQIVAAAAAQHDGARSFLGETVGRSAVPLTTHVALAADSAAVSVLARAMADWLADTLRGSALAGLPVLAAAAPFKSGGLAGPENFTDIPPGPLARRHLADLYPYPNTVRAVVATGAQLADWLERSAAIYHRLRPGLADQPLIDPHVPGYLCDQIPGLSYRIDLSQPPRHAAECTPGRPGAGRIRDLCHAGRPVAPGDRFVLATNSYRLATLQTAGQCFEAIDVPPRSCRDVLADWIAAQGIVTAPPASDWRLRFPPGASAVLDTAPTARLPRGGLPGLRVDRLGLTPAGFLRLRLTPED
jgi:2',3'-cyclic-nucleotide 2'-phosphodiesterase/3'-nucleotidase